MGGVVLLAVIVAALVLDELVVVLFQTLGDAMRCRTSFNAENCDWIVPNEEILAWIDVALACSCCRGCFSMATSLVMMSLTLRPLPMPIEEMVAMMASAGF